MAKVLVCGRAICTNSSGKKRLLCMHLPIAIWEAFNAFVMFVVVRVQAKGNRGAGGSAAKKASKGGNPAGNALSGLGTNVPQVGTAPKKASKAASKAGSKANKTANKAASKVCGPTSTPAALPPCLISHTGMLLFFTKSKHSVCTTDNLVCCGNNRPDIPCSYVSATGK